MGHRQEHEHKEMIFEYAKEEMIHPSVDVWLSQSGAILLNKGKKNRF